MKNKILLFEPRISGHVIEYIHHLYVGMLKCQDCDFVIVVPDEFYDKKDVFEWPASNKIVIDLMSSSDVLEMSKGNILYQAYKRCRLLSKFVKKHNATDVILLFLMKYNPFLFLFINKNVNVKGIIYKIYLYEWKRISIVRKCFEVFKYFALVHTGCVKHIFVLNDLTAASRFNKLYKTCKFSFIPDPYNDIRYIPVNRRCEFHIPSQNRVYLHFGGLSERKGTISILNAWQILPDSVRSKVTLVFAGKVYDNIHNEFYRLYNELKSSCQIFVFDEFCSNELLADLCYTCDYILIPYKNTSQSSGLLGHAAYYAKPIIGPSEGLVGKLIRKNRLGLCLKEVTPQSIADIVQSNHVYVPSSNYSERILPEKFVEPFL